MKTFTPYRICPLGAHVDHQGGIVTGFAINHGVTIEYELSQQEPDIIRLNSINFPGEVVFSVKRIPQKQNDWGDYARAALTSLLNEGYEIKLGFEGEISGTLQIGGLSSSASVIIAYITTICKVNGIHVSGAHMVSLALWAERNFIGLSVGKLDQSCEVFSKKNQLLYLDTKTDKMELVKHNPNMQPYQIAIFFSGLEHSLVNSNYNARVDECKTAAYSLMAYAGNNYARWQDAKLSDVDQEIFKKYGDRLPENFYKRAKHFYEENERVKKGVLAFRNGDLKTFGRLMFESGTSSIELYESGSLELKAMHEIAQSIDGIYGGRFSGAGFKGCYLAFIDPDKKESIEKNMEERYLAMFPELAGRYGCHFCETADGTKLP